MSVQQAIQAVLLEQLGGFTLVSRKVFGYKDRGLEAIKAGDVSSGLWPVTELSKGVRL